MSDDRQLLFQIHLQEFSKLKDEQTARIGFRDNLLYATLVGFGGVLSFALSKESHYYALLVIPWVCLILGWTYLVNDEKITAIGRYLRITLAKKLEEQGKFQPGTLLGWEEAHRGDRQRKRRKFIQLVIDEITFVLSGIIAIYAFWALAPQAPIIVQVLSWVEFALLAFLGLEILLYADLAKSKKEHP